MHGYSWTDIGSVLGVTRQAAQQRFLAPHKRYNPEDFTEELREAMSRVKEVAIRYRNNYIGTEHLLWGTISGNNSATRILETHGVSAYGLRDALQARLSLGASQAAERIAFTPYSRKTLAIAEELAMLNGSPGIGCDHLLVGLVRTGRGVAATVLSEAGIDSTTLRDFPPPAQGANP